MTHYSDDEDEKSLFQKHMHGVRPLKNNTKTPHFTEKPLVSRQKRHISVDQTHSTLTQPLSNPHTLEIHAESILSYHQPGLIAKRFKTLTKGAFTLEARLDLHGLNIDTASDALSHFILTSFNRGLRHLLIIHGKGGQQGDIAILKSHVAHWLKQFPQVLAFHSAQPKDGGSGALYLLLKRHSADFHRA